MKKTLTVMLMVLLAAALIISCDNSSSTPKDEGSSSKSGETAAKATYTVTFTLGEGTGEGFDAQTVTEGDKAVKPTANPKANDKYKTFAFWSLDGTNEFKFNETAITEDIILKAVYKDYEVGDTGPAGGTIFYVNSAFNENSSDNNWKYLEAAPSDLTVENDGTTTSKIAFGYYVKSDESENYSTFCILGEYTSGSSVDTAAIGKGASNTSSLINATGGGWTEGGREDRTPFYDYAAKLCADFTCGGCGDWFLPSLNELTELYKAYADGTVGGTWHTKYSSDLNASDNEYYWSSTEYDSNSVWTVCFGNNGRTGGQPRNDGYSYVRPVRSF